MSGPTPSPSLIAARPGVVVAIAVGLAVVLLALAFTWEGDSSTPSRSKRIVDAVDVVVPAPLRDEELKETTSGAFQERVALESGAWVQVADEAGRLQQRYRAKRIDRGYGVFGVAADTGAEAQAALAALVPDDG